MKDLYDEWMDPAPVIANQVAERVVTETWNRPLHLWQRCQHQFFTRWKLHHKD
jgi:hypothetical protein